MTTSNTDFYFGLLRVSILQILKAQGFDKAKTSTVDTLTDLYTKFMNLLILEVVKLSQARSDEDDIIALQDITQAFINLGIVKPNELLDVYDENAELPSDTGFKLLRDWCVNSVELDNSRKVALPSVNMLKFSGDNNNPINNLMNNNNGTNGNGTSNSSANGNGLLPINSSKQQKQVFAIPEYINTLQPDQQEELEKEKEKETELIEDLINNGDTDDWIRLLITRQKLNLYNKKHNKNTPASTSTAFTHSGSSNPTTSSIPDINSLPNIVGLKHSILYDTLKANNSSFDYRNKNASSEIKTHNESDPSLSKGNIGLNSELNLAGTVDMERNVTSEENNSLISRATLLMEKLPIMKPESKLENISLSYDNMEIDSESDQDQDQYQNSHSRIEPDDSIELENNALQLTGDNSNNINFDEYGDMDNTFQRRESLDYGNPPMF